MELKTIPSFCKDTVYLNWGGMGCEDPDIAAWFNLKDTVFVKIPF